MVFRKDSLLFFQSEIFYIAVMMLGFACPLGSTLSFLCVSFSAVFIAITPRMHGEYMTINETGISCWESGSRLWGYEWKEITALKKGSRYMLPSIEILVYDKNGMPETYAAPGHYFQLDRKARFAV